MRSTLARRRFLKTAGGFAVAAHPTLEAAAVTGPAYVFAAAGHIIRMTVRFFDNYKSSGFAFRNTTQDFCLSGSGDSGRNCLSRFDGALAIAQYQLQSPADSAAKFSLREVVRSIDGDAGLALKPPSEKVILFDGGTASDIQAFGVAHETSEVALRSAVWCVLRQDLFLNNGAAPFLVVHWKHTVTAIRLLDVIPVGDTHMLGKSLPGKVEAR